MEWIIFVNCLEDVEHLQGVYPSQAMDGKQRCLIRLHQFLLEIKFRLQISGKVRSLFFPDVRPGDCVLAINFIFLFSLPQSGLFALIAVLVVNDIEIHYFQMGD